MENFDRAIDDPGLNQDATFDHKDSEDFDASDDFHKLDDTTKDQQEEKKSDADKTTTGPTKKAASTADFDGYLNV